MAGALAVAVAALVAPSGVKPDPVTSTASGTTKPAARKTQVAVRHVPLRLADRHSGSLDAPVQDGAVAVLPGGKLIVAGGLTAADTSTADIRLVGATGDRPIGMLPVAVHDAGAAELGGAVYVFGGGDGVGQHDEIIRISVPSGQTSVAGHLPAPSSDQAVASAGGSAYVVGGYTGTQWLDTVVRWRPGRAAKIVAHLPSPVRYAAVTAVGRSLVVAGGSLPDGTASRAIYRVDVSTGRVVRIGSLPSATTHAAAATIGGEAFVVGGRSASLDTPMSRIVAIDAASGHVRLAGVLRVARSDEEVAPLANGLLVAGGWAHGGTVASIDRLVPVALVPVAKAAHATARATAAVRSANVYAADGAGKFAPATRGALPRVYVPNSLSNTVDVIDPRTDKIVEHFAVGALPQHIVPSYDLKTLYVTNDNGNSLTPINPRTSKPGTPISVVDPYNMYFTPNGRYAIVVAERFHRLDFRNAHTFRLHRSVPVPCTGVDHMDFSADGSYLIASCEFSGQLVKVDVRSEKVVGTLTLPDGSRGMPQDVKLSPDGKVFYVADMMANGLWEVDGDTFKVIRLLHTGKGVHGLYVSRDARFLYATNRGEGSISVINLRTRKAVAKWWIPGGGSPDMGNVSADGKVLWLTGRYNGVVYKISTANGKLLAKIPVGSGPHGLCVWPEPGRYSLGHTGILR